MAGRRLDLKRHDASGADLPTEATRAGGLIGNRLLVGGYRAEIGLLGLLLVGTLFLRKSVPLGIYGLGVVSGSALALQGIALVLVFRSNRIINFAQASFGFAAALVFSALVQYRSLLRLVDPICPSDCVSNPVAVRVNYVLALVICLGIAAGLGALTYRFVVRRFASAPPLLLTLATIFVGSVIVGLTSQLTQRLIPEELRESGTPPPGSVAATPPFDLAFDLGGARFHLVDLLTILVAMAALIGLSIYLRRSSTGNVIRAAADNPDRAATLGVNVSAVTARVWVLASLLAGTAGILTSMSQGAATTLGTSALEVRILAIAVVARMVSFPMVAVAGLVFGVVQESLQWSVGSTILLDALLFVVIGLLLMVQSGKLSRTERARVGQWRSAREIRPIPQELRGLPIVRKWTKIGATLVAVVLLGFPWLSSPASTNLAAAVLVYAIIGLSLLVLTGWAGQISLGQVAFAAIGAYVAAISHLPFGLSLLLGGLAGGVAALIVGLPALRLKGLHLAVITLAFHQAVIAIGLNPAYLGKYLPDSIKRPTLLGMDFADQRIFYYLTLALTALIFVSVLGMRRSRTARALLAIRDNEEAAQVFGINLTRARVGAFTVSGFIAAFGGVILAYHQGAVQGAAFGVELSREIFLHSVIGGLGTVVGPLIGFVYYGIPLFFTLPALIALLFSRVGGLILLLFSPGGLAQLIFEVRDGWLRKLARSHKIRVPSLLADSSAGGNEEPLRLAPKMRPGGGTVFVPTHYALSSQWAITGVDPHLDRPREPLEEVLDVP